MLQSTHTDKLLPDYVLGLLPAAERRDVETHVRDCPACRAALQREKAAADLLRVAVRNAVQRAAQPAPGRLAALRPPLPAARPPALYLRLAPVTLVLAILALGLLFGPGRQPFTPGLFAPPTATADSSAAAAATATATSTHTPTATLALRGGDEALLDALEATRPPRGRTVYPARTIAPSATPIVAASP